MILFGITELLSSPIVVILLIVLIAAVIFSLSSLKPNPKVVKEDVEKILKNNNISYSISEALDNSYSFVLTIGDTKYATLVLPIEKFAEVTINNFNTWEMHFGAGDKPGKAQPFKSKISEIPNFMAYQTELNKLVLIQPNAKQIVVWKNENEIVDVDPKIKVYGVNVLNVSDLPKLFK